MTQFNPFASYLLEDKPEAAFFSYSDQFGGPSRDPRQRNFFSNQFSNIYNQYLGSLGKQIRAGMLPTGQFQDYLGGLDFTDWYRQQVPYQQRSQGFSDFVPRTSFRIPGINA